METQEKNAQTLNIEIPVTKREKAFFLSNPNLMKGRIREVISEEEKRQNKIGLLFKLTDRISDRIEKNLSQEEIEDITKYIDNLS
jgi:hypothetical protein